ncbi:MAG TPA: pyridoxamine 5'-phosphate oxidase family protein [Roseiflexaceae bacterium]
MLSEELAIVANLICGQRQAALGTLRDPSTGSEQNGAPFVSMVAYAAEPDFGGFLLHLSRLAPHTRHLLAAPQAALLICEPDDGREDVQTLARITLAGPAAPIAAGSPEHAAARARYLARLPAAAPLFDFPDFALFRLAPAEARYVGGFARAYTLTPEHLRQAARLQATEGTERTEHSFEL